MRAPSTPWPRKAFLLAAGWGSRMEPLSREIPKPLLPLWGKPMLGHALDLLAAWGVEDVLVNAHHRADALLDFVARHAGVRPRIQISFEPVLLGTGGALVRARWFVDGAPFWLLNADVAADVSPAPLLAAFRRGHPLAAVWLEPGWGPRTVRARDGWVTGFRAARAGAPGTATLCGLHLLAPEILRWLPREERQVSIVEAYERALRSGRRIAGVTVPSAFWADVGTPEQYLEAHRRVQAAYRAGRPGARLYDPAGARAGARAARRADVTLAGSVAIGRGVRWGAGASVRDAVVMDGARIARGARLAGVIVGPGTPVRGTVTRLVMRAEMGLDASLAAALVSKDWKIKTASLQALEPRGSARAFFRLRAADRTAILVRYRLERPENALYARQARFLRRLGLRVPRVLHDEPAGQWLLLEDLGDVSLQDVVRRGPRARVAAAYRRVLEQMARLHRLGADRARAEHLPLMPAFDAALYRWEREYFIRHVVRGLLRAPAALERRVRRELRDLAARLRAAPPVLVHRDLQSSNILMPRGGAPAWIDFQGMRLGAAAYDLASLLCDPYVALPADLRAELLAYYASLGPAARRSATDFRWAAVERLAQAMGAFANLGAQPATAGFLRHLQPAAALLQGLGLDPALFPGLLRVLRRIRRKLIHP